MLRISTPWRDRLLAIGEGLENRFDLTRRALRRRLGRAGPATILPYLGYGDPSRLRLRGRVLESRGLRQPRPGTWGNLAAMWRRFMSAEVPGARVRAGFKARAVETVTDGEGYFEVALDGLDMTSTGARWCELDLALLEPMLVDPAPTKGRVQVPSSTAQLAVISDVDDTIIKTGANVLWRNLRTTLLGSAETRLPFPGLASFYRALERGTGPEPANPIFYVSSSPWNLYDLLERFMALHGIPPGPMFLRDFGLDRTKFVASSHREHKLEAIERLLPFYPRLRFILVGDSGQHDAAIYAESVRRHPGRIAAVYIRDVTPSPEIDREVQTLLTAVQRAGARSAFCPDLLEAARDAAAARWITEAAVAEVRREVAADGAG